MEQYCDIMIVTLTIWITISVILTYWQGSERPQIWLSITPDCHALNACNLNDIYIKPLALFPNSHFSLDFPYLLLLFDPQFSKKCIFWKPTYIWSSIVAERIAVRLNLLYGNFAKERYQPQLRMTYLPRFPKKYWQSQFSKP